MRPFPTLSPPFPGKQPGHGATPPRRPPLPGRRARTHLPRAGPGPPRAGRASGRPAGRAPPAAAARRRRRPPCPCRLAEKFVKEAGAAPARGGGRSAPLPPLSPRRLARRPPRPGAPAGPGAARWGSRLRRDERGGGGTDSPRTPELLCCWASGAGGRSRARTSNPRSPALGTGNVGLRPAARRGRSGARQRLLLQARGQHRLGSALPGSPPLRSDRLSLARRGSARHGFPWHSSARLFSALSGTAQPGSVRLRSARLSTARELLQAVVRAPRPQPPTRGKPAASGAGGEGRKAEGAGPAGGREVGAGSVAEGSGSRVLGSGEGPHASGGSWWLIPLLKRSYRWSGERDVISAHQTAWLYPRVRVRGFAFFGNTCLAPNASKCSLFSIGMVINSIAIIPSFPCVIAV